MKKIWTSRTVHVIVLSIALGAASGVLATAMTNSYLSDYALQLDQLTRPLSLETSGPKAFPNSYAEATKHFSDSSLASVVSIFPKFAKTTYGFTEDASIGTGVIVTSDGWIVAPSLSIVSADALAIQIKDQVYDVVRVVADPMTQTVFLKCNVSNLPVVGFGKALDLSVGDQLFVSARVNQFAPASVVEQVWQQGTVLSSDVPSRRVSLSTHASVTSAPVFDLSGSFVGFVSKKDAQVLLSPFEHVLPSLNALLEKKAITHPVLGVSYLDLAHAVGVSDKFHRGHRVGAYVTGYPTSRKGSPAALAGIKEGDIILSMNGQELDQTRGLNERLLSARAGDKISLMIDRTGEKSGGGGSASGGKITIEVVLGQEKK